MITTQDEKMDKVRSLLFDVQTKYIPFHDKKRAAASVEEALALLQIVNDELQHDQRLMRRQAAIAKRNVKRLEAAEKKHYVKCEFGHEFATNKTRRICPIVEPITGRKCRAKLYKVN